MPVDGTSCLGVDGSVYCVGGYSNNALVANVYSTDVGPGMAPWVAGHDYGDGAIPIYKVSVETLAFGYLMGVGGHDGTTSQVWYAPILNPTTSSTTSTASSTQTSSSATTSPTTVTSFTTSSTSTSSVAVPEFPYSSVPDTLVTVLVIVLALTALTARGFGLQNKDYPT